VATRPGNEPSASNAGRRAPNPDSLGRTPLVSSPWPSSCSRGWGSSSVSSCWCVTRLPITARASPRRSSCHSSWPLLWRTGSPRSCNWHGRLPDWHCFYFWGSSQSRESDQRLEAKVDALLRDGASTLVTPRPPDVAAGGPAGDCCGRHPVRGPVTELRGDHRPVVRGCHSWPVVGAACRGDGVGVRPVAAPAARGPRCDHVH
jgi:hypothetical protein